MTNSRNYILRKFFESNGTDALSTCFTHAYDADENCVVNRCAIVTTNIVIGLRSHPVCKDSKNLYRYFRNIFSARIRTSDEFIDDHAYQIKSKEQ